MNFKIGDLVSSRLSPGTLGLIIDEGTQSKGTLYFRVQWIGPIPSESDSLLVADNATWRLPSDLVSAN